MDGYTLLERIGSGTFSTVYRAREAASGRVVAVKELTDASLTWDAVQRMPEVLASRALAAHENVLRLHAVHRLGGRVFLVMDHCAGSLLDALARRAAAGAPGLTEAEARFVARRILLALAHVHAAGYAHRDVKPENVLLAGAAGGGGAARPVLADFGQIRRLDGAPLTPYVSTRWYRAPEVLLRAGTYDSKADVWAVGAMLVELLTGRPAFPGASEADQVYRLCAALGAPSPAVWRDAHALAAAAGVALPPLPGEGAAALLPARASPAAAAAVAAMLAWDPAARVSAQAALALPFFGPTLPETPLVLAAAPSRPDEVAARADAAVRQTAIEAELAALAIGDRGDQGKEDDDGDAGRGGKEADRAPAAPADSDSDEESEGGLRRGSSTASAPTARLGGAVRARAAPFFHAVHEGSAGGGSGACSVGASAGSVRASAGVPAARRGVAAAPSFSPAASEDSDSSPSGKGKESDGDSEPGYSPSFSS
jgi:serine/threonine protein kinase